MHFDGCRVARQAGCTPLHYAAACTVVTVKAGGVAEQPSAALLHLVAAGARLSARNRAYQTPVQTCMAGVDSMLVKRADSTIALLRQHVTGLQVLRARVCVCVCVCMCVYVCVCVYVFVCVTCSSSAPPGVAQCVLFAFTPAGGHVTSPEVHAGFIRGRRSLVDASRQRGAARSRVLVWQGVAGAGTEEAQGVVRAAL